MTDLTETVCACGHDLRGLQGPGFCPKCGTPTRPWLRRADTAWLRLIASGAGIGPWSHAALFAAAVLNFVVLGVFDSFRTSEGFVAMAVVSMPALVLIFLSTFLLTVTEPGSLQSGAAWVHRASCIVMLGSALGVWALGVWDPAHLATPMAAFIYTAGMFSFSVWIISGTYALNTLIARITGECWDEAAKRETAFQALLSGFSICTSLLFLVSLLMYTAQVVRLRRALRAHAP